MAPAATVAPAATTAPSAAAHEPHHAHHADLAAEHALLADARAAMQASDPARALAILDDHARRFPRGQLAEERDALRVGALWLSGDHAAARRIAGEFARRHPGSLFLPSVQRTVTDADAPSQ
jgi:outer membrane protein assembly factor BamD (BamD/ComL family)